MQLSVVFQNILAGGDVRGRRWGQLKARFTDGGLPDVLALSECLDWNRDDKALLREAAADLGLAVAGLTEVRSLDGQPCAILYNQAVLGDHTGWFDRFACWHGAGVATFAPPGLGDTLHIGVAHLDPYSATAALIEAQTIGARLVFPPDHDPLALVLADWNAPPEHGPAADHAGMYPGARAARTTLVAEATDEVPEVREPNRAVAAAMRNADLFDVAWELYQQTGDMGLLARTGATDRIDRGHASPRLAACARSYRRRILPATATDHAGIEIVFDLADVRARAEPGLDRS